MKVFVTGSNGFIGQHLCYYLESKGLEIIRGSRQLCGDYLSVLDWREYFVGCDAVIHLAARVHKLEERNKDIFNEYLNMNLHLTMKMACAASECQVKKFIFLSSIKAMVTEQSLKNTPDKHIQSLHTEDLYGVSKYEAEVALLDMAKESKMDIFILRPPLVYGPRSKANFASLINIVNKKLPLPFAGFKEKRSFVYIGNLVHFIEYILRLDESFNHYPIFYVADEKRVSTNELIGMIASSMNIRNPCFYFPPMILKIFLTLIGKRRTYDKLNTPLSISSSEARKFFNWEPPYTIDEGIKRTVDNETCF